jgi:hypothetical protein
MGPPVVYVKKSSNTNAITALFSLARYFFSHFWLATVHEVLQADWHDAWHSPHPISDGFCLKTGSFIVLMCFIGKPPVYNQHAYYTFGPAF